MIKIVNAFESLENISKDEVMMQKVALLTGGEDMALFIIELEEDQTLPAHYHKEGIEFYYIISGEAVIRIGNFHNGKIEKIKKEIVKAGDTFSIQAYTVHEISNSQLESVKLLAVAPLSHNGADRYFIELE
ncbi:cupin domain-containing protein [Chryseobacterium sp. W4I1]|uniref:cupin domain-containing protein n=1 Tax=Chryseobacterium sp. W4I1 TaxID=3042293 RepID=UPI00277D3CCF|nr:cupin domain-containing protein [Chryseobacterium sp. W4I1]MDQ0782944.1 quercetin dioxygenase-like cupin family protein [Chryseobacterium sp. W4I1]